MPLPVFVENVPTYTVRDGRMLITLGDMEMLMPLHVFLKGCQLGKDAIKEWQSERRGTVVPIKATVEH